MKGLFVIIPAYNEELRIAEVIKKAKKYTKNIIIVDDGSKDKTYETAKKEKTEVLRHVINLGKGAALKTGCDYALHEGAEILILIDGDGQHNPDKIPEFVKKLEEYEIVFGMRKLNRKMPLLRRIGNWGLNQITRFIFSIKVEDAMCGYRAFTSPAYRKIRWKSSGYEVEAEMIANAGKHKLKAAQLEIETIYADAYKGMTIFDGIRVGLNMLWWKLTK